MTTITDTTAAHPEPTWAHADLLDGRVKAPEVRWERDSQTYVARCGCGWRYYASTRRHAEVRVGEHVRDDPCTDSA